MTSSLRIIVSGLVGLYPIGGVAWDYFQYVIGLAKLGHDVYYHEDTWSWPYHPIEKENISKGEYSAQYIRDFMEKYAPELRERWHYLHLHQESFGMDRATFDEISRTADVFLNVSGACIIPDQLSSNCVKIFLDSDPGYNQIMMSERFSWSENVDRWCESVMAHDLYFTYAENIHQTDCLIPKLDLDWKTTRMPVVLELWDAIAKYSPPRSAPWTTVMTWNAFKGKLIYQGTEYTSKGSEFEKLITLPQRVNIPLKVAVGGIKAPLKQLTSEGWQVVDGPTESLIPKQYQGLIAGSRGEISPAKNVYVAMRTGWFSCRSACYLASGRPVVVQDTNFSKFIPTGKGLFAFSNLEEAAESIKAIEKDYKWHQKGAIEIAVEFFDAKKVLSEVLKKSGLS